MKPEAYVDIFLDETRSAAQACFDLVDAAADLRFGVKANYRGRWIAAAVGDDPHRLHKVLLDTPPDWPDIVSLR